MPNCDFYALGADHRLILRHLLDQGECEIFELYSRPGCELVQFRSLDDFLCRYQFSDWDTIPETIHLHLYPNAARGFVEYSRIALSKPASPDQAFRYSSEGWGLIQLYLEAPRNGALSPSHTNHNSPARAATWSDTYPELRDPSLWDWDVVLSFSRRLNAFIRKQAVAKAGSRGILPGADCFRQSGNELSLN